MTRHNVVHEIRLGPLRATIWQEPPAHHRDLVADQLCHEQKYAVTIQRLELLNHRQLWTERFLPADLPLLAELADLAHLWICEQAPLVA